MPNIARGPMVPIQWQGEAISSVRTDKSNLHLVSFRKSTGGLPLSFDVRGHE